jgi:hypothetical protein
MNFRTKIYIPIFSHQNFHTKSFIPKLSYQNYHTKIMIPKFSFSVFVGQWSRASEAGTPSATGPARDGRAGDDQGCQIFVEFRTKISTILVYFGRPWKESFFYIFYEHLRHFIVICYIFPIFVYCFTKNVSTLLYKYNIFDPFPTASGRG